jgi:hypothetical protein
MTIQEIERDLLMAVAALEATLENKQHVADAGDHGMDGLVRKACNSVRELADRVRSIAEAAARE